MLNNFFMLSGIHIMKIIVYILHPKVWSKLEHCRPIYKANHTRYVHKYWSGIPINYQQMIGITQILIPTCKFFVDTTIDVDSWGPCIHLYTNPTLVQYTIDKSKFSPIKLKYRWTGWSSRLLENYPSYWWNLENMPQINKEQPKDVNMYLVGLANTRILTDHVQKCPHTLLRATSHYGHPSREAVGLNGQTSLRVQINGLKIAN